MQAPDLRQCCTMCLHGPYAAPTQGAAMTGRLEKPRQTPSLSQISGFQDCSPDAATTPGMWASVLTVASINRVRRLFCAAL